MNVARFGKITAPTTRYPLLFPSSG